MRKILYLFFAILILSGCGSSKKQLQKGNYDSAIQKAVKKLMRNPNSPKDVEALDRSYMLANEQDLNRIKYLKMERKPENWEEIVQHYQSLKYRYNTVRPVLPLNLNGKAIDYENVDYDASIIEAKHNAAEFFFGHGQKLMASNNKDSYRQAYMEFTKVKEYWGDYQNIDQLLEESHARGMSSVIVYMDNQTQFRLSKQFQDDLLAVNPQDLNSEWVDWDTRSMDKNAHYDYEVRIVLRTIDVSPDDSKEIDKIEKKKVEDGFDYVLDKNGNVMRDSLGNDIKLTKYKNLSCTLIETAQHKAAHIEGMVETYSTNPEKLLRKDPIASDSFFEHFSARAIGDKDALTPESKEKVKAEPIPFPSDGEMIMKSSQALQIAIRGILQKNRSIIY